MSISNLAKRNWTLNTDAFSTTGVTTVAQAAAIIDKMAAVLNTLNITYHTNDGSDIPVGIASLFTEGAKG